VPRGRGPHECREGSTSATSRAAETFIVTGHNPERVRSEAAFARLCGVAPIPASSGMTTRRRLNRGGHRKEPINAVIESFGSRTQVELLDRRRWRTRRELANAIYEYLEISTTASASTPRADG